MGYIIPIFQTLYGPYGPYITQHTRKYGPYDPHIAEIIRKYGLWGPYIAQPTRNFLNITLSDLADVVGHFKYFKWPYLQFPGVENPKSDKNQNILKTKFKNQTVCRRP